MFSARLALLSGTGDVIVCSPGLVSTRDTTDDLIACASWQSEPDASEL